MRVIFGPGGSGFGPLFGPNTGLMLIVGKFMEPAKYGVSRSAHYTPSPSCACNSARETQMTNYNFLPLSCIFMFGPRSPPGLPDEQLQPAMAIIPLVNYGQS